MEKERYVSPEIKIVMLDGMDRVLTASIPCNNYTCEAYIDSSCVGDYCDADTHPCRYQNYRL